MTTQRTSPKKKAKELTKLLRVERPDYPCLKSVFWALQEELEIVVARKEERLPEVPTEDEMLHFYQAVWNCRNFADMVLIKTLFYMVIVEYLFLFEPSFFMSISADEHIKHAHL